MISFFSKDQSTMMEFANLSVLVAKGWASNLLKPVAWTTVNLGKAESTQAMYVYTDMRYCK